MLDAIGRFFGPPENSAKGLITPEEHYRSILLSVFMAALVAAVMAGIDSFIPRIPTLLSDPTAGAFLTAFLTVILDQLRRTNQGQVTLRTD